MSAKKTIPRHGYMANAIKMLAHANASILKPGARATNATAQIEQRFDSRADKLLRRFSWEDGE